MCGLVVVVVLSRARTGGWLHARSWGCVLRKKPDRLLPPEPSSVPKLLGVVEHWLAAAFRNFPAELLSFALPGGAVRD